MKKITIVFLLMFWSLSATTASASEATKAAHKLSRGLLMIAAAPLEIPVQARAYWKKGAAQTPHILAWIFSGTVKGMVNMTVRIGSGAWDIVTFPLPLPRNYAPLVSPDDLEAWDKEILS